jgi:2-dehydropantoate 2-reductase
MKVLMFGRGVIAVIYGWAFAGAGHEVSYYVRPGSAARKSGRIDLDIIDERGSRGARGARSVRRVRGNIEARCIESLDATAEYDIVVLCVGPGQMREAAQQLAAAPRPRRGVLFFNNCWEDPEELRSLFSPQHSLWGFPVAGGSFTSERNLTGTLTASAHMAAENGTNEALHASVRGLFTDSGISLQFHTDMRCFLWLHFAANAGMIAKAIRLPGGANELIGSSRELRQAVLLAREAVNVARCRGATAREEQSQVRHFFLPQFLIAGILKSMAERNEGVRRMMTLNSNPAGMDRFPRVVLEEARRLGISCPRLSMALAN